MATAMKTGNWSAIRQAVRELKPCYGQDVSGTWFRFNQFAVKRGISFGRSLNTGKWTAIYQWEVR